MPTAARDKFIHARLTYGLIGLGLALASGTAARAADAIEVAALERAARTGSPVLQAARAKAQEALMLAEAAGVRGDPELELWVRNALPDLTSTSDQPVAVEVEIVQPVRWPGKRGALEAVAAAETQAALAEVVVAEQELVGEVRRTFADLYADTGEARYLALSRKFHHRAILEPLARGEDILPGKHANTQIPKLIGLATRRSRARRDPHR